MRGVWRICPVALAVMTFFSFSRHLLQTTNARTLRNMAASHGTQLSLHWQYIHRDEERLTQIRLGFFRWLALEACMQHDTLRNTRYVRPTLFSAEKELNCSVFNPLDRSACPLAFLSALVSLNCVAAYAAVRLRIWSLEHALKFS